MPSAAENGNKHNLPRLLLIELDRTSRIDKSVLPAVIEFTLKDILVTRRNLGENAQRHTVFTCIDRIPEEYDKLFKRCSISSGSVIDGFSEWFSSTTEENDGNASREQSERRRIHLADVDPTSHLNGSLLTAITDAMNEPSEAYATEKVVVIDSISTLQRFWSDIQIFLRLRDALDSASSQITPNASLTLVCTVRSAAPPSVQLNAVKKLASVHIHVQQTSASAKQERAGFGVQNRDAVTLTVSRLKESGRVHLDNYIASMDWKNEKLSAKKIQSEGTAASTENLREYQESLLKDLGLSFRVDLTASEREVRASTSLPYLHRDEALADSALELHPEELQINHQDSSLRGEDDSDTDSEEELFSEDV